MRERHDILTTLSASRVIGVPPDTLRWMVRTGRIRATRLENGQYIYTRSDCEAEAARRRALSDEERTA
jgi:predicted site-specific integrase-resolvase